MREYAEKTGYVYIMASGVAGAVYIGVTSDLLTRVLQHKNKTYGGFTKDHDIDRLVYYEACGDMEHAILREKAMKKWRREWKVRLIEKANPKWADLHPALMREEYSD